MSETENNIAVGQLRKVSFENLRIRRWSLPTVKTCWTIEVHHTGKKLLAWETNGFEWIETETCILLLKVDEEIAIALYGERLIVIGHEWIRNNSMVVNLE